MAKEKKETKIKSKDFFWQMQNMKSFCKAKSDWLAFDKVHMSFVKHKGKPAFTQESSIDGAFQLHGENGVLFLSDMILTGVLDKKAKISKEAAKEKKSQYAEAVFTSPGGTAAKRSGKNEVVYRQITISPGNTKDYTMTMGTCEGREDEDGKIMPVKGAKWDNILIALSRADLYNFARAVQTEYAAYRTYCLMSDTSWNSYALSLADKDTDAIPAKTEPISTPASAPAPIEINDVILIYDAKGLVNEGVPVAVTLDEAEKTLNSIVKGLYTLPQKFLADKAQYAASVVLINKTSSGCAQIAFSGKEEKAETDVLMVVRGPLYSEKHDFAFKS